MYRTLVDTHTLAQHLDDRRWVVVDCRFVLSDPEAGRRAYAAGHIPGARYAHLDEDLSAPTTPTSGRHPLPTPQALAERFSAWGIGADSQVVVYDDSFGAIAARLWWLLRWLGHDAVALLDGGLPKWTREGYTLSPEPPQIERAKFTPRPKTDAHVDSTFVVQHHRDADFRLLDARAEERFLGDVEPLDKVAGHIPGARNLPYDDNLALSGEFLSPVELREVYAAKIGALAPSRVVHMCGSGVTACHNLLAMEHAGLSGARLYVGSWSEWITDPRRPIATGAE